MRGLRPRRWRCASEAWCASGRHSCAMQMRLSEAAVRLPRSCIANSLANVLDDRQALFDIEPASPCCLDWPCRLRARGSIRNSADPRTAGCGGSRHALAVPKRMTAVVLYLALLKTNLTSFAPPRIASSRARRTGRTTSGLDRQAGRLDRPRVIASFAVELGETQLYY